jgi:hypothetical protein
MNELPALSELSEADKSTVYGILKTHAEMQRRGMIGSDDDATRFRDIENLERVAAYFTPKVSPLN